MLNVNIQISEKYAPLFELKPAYQHYGLVGGRGGSKSHGAGTAAVFLANAQKENIVYGRQFHASFKKSVKALLVGKIDQLHLNSNFTILDDEIRNVNTGSIFSFIGLDRSPNSVRSFEGATLTILEEAQDIKQDSIDVLIPTVFRTPNSRAWWIWNPDKPDTPVDSMLRGPSPPPGTLLIPISWRDNPYFRELGMDVIARHLKNINPVKYKHIWEGEYYDGGESRIFSNVEIKDIEVPETIRPQYGLDFGMQNDPNAFVKLYVNEKEKWIYIAREWFGGCATEELAEGIGSEDGIPECKQGTIVADSAWPGSIATLNKSGFKVVPAKKGAGSVLDGIKWLQDFQIYISPYCPRMREEANMYSWQLDRHTKKILKIPEDVYNHGWDAVRYATEENRRGGGGSFYKKV